MESPLPVLWSFVSKLLVQLLYLVNLIGIVGSIELKGLYPTLLSHIFHLLEMNPLLQATGDPVEEAAEVIRSPPNHVFPAVSGFCFPFFLLIYRYSPLIARELSSRV